MKRDVNKTVDRAIDIYSKVKKARVDYTIAKMFGMENLPLACLNLIKEIVDIKDED